MSRTNKDKKVEVRYGEEVFTLDVPDVRKKRKSFEPIVPMATPSWWTRLMMNRPQRRKSKMWERMVLIEADLELTDPPQVGDKPHIYYY